MVELKYFDFGEHQHGYEGSPYCIRPLEKDEDEKLVSVLAYYGFNFNYVNGKIYINPKDTLDREILVNLCRKSKDTAWMKEHIK